ncbi:MAG TPA: sialate O-acetylesterase, partial [Lachnospiraceae bacterium]|nr:sialate O-acetylesterase [Lachnospiraceae bacterium]
IIEYPGGKKGSLVSSFVNSYYEETGVPVIAVSASAGATTSEYWTRTAIVNDFAERHERAVVWLESNECSVRNQYVVWLQGESDADAGITAQQYSENMDNIIRPLFIKGVQKVFIIRPGRTLDDEHFFDDIIQAQTEMCKDSSYYALASTLLAGFDTSYMVDQWHYCQTALNLLGEDAGKNVAYYTNNKKEACMYDYKYHNTYIPDHFDYPADMEAEPILIEPMIKVNQ